MLRRIDLRGGGGDGAETLPRAGSDVAEAIEVVRPICEAVKQYGHAELVRLARLFDGVTLDTVRVPGSALDAALAALEPPVRNAMETAIEHLRRTCAAELPTDVATRLSSDGVVTQRQVPLGRVGLYVPGARAPLVSSVLMNVVPAQVAGVESLAVASPANAAHGGLPHPTILAACALLGVEEVYAAGGAGAIAMFAYGYADVAPGCQPVDLVTGPANVYGVAAKRLLRGVVGIDSEAGPTEIAILADASADPVFVAADLLSQAEHDPAAASVLITDAAELAAATELEVKRQVADTRHVQRVTDALSGRQSAIVLVDDLERGEEIVNAYAPEHLEIHTVDAAERAARIRNAGAIFVGPYAPVSLGDYCAGSNHVLPTGGSARHASGLSVRTYLRTVQVVDYSRQALARVAADVQALADAEDLPAHGAAIRVRLGRRP